MKNNGGTDVALHELHLFGICPGHLPPSFAYLFCIFFKIAGPESLPEAACGGISSSNAINPKKVIQTGREKITYCTIN